MESASLRRKIGIMGGSFNPVHIGHMIVASYIAQLGGVDEVWLMLSPQNPLKQGDDALLPDDVRMAMLRIAVGDNPRLKVCDIELSMPRPNYTINTLRRLAAEHLDCDFKLIVGTDNWQSFHRWRAPEEIIGEFGLIVYPRPGYPAADATATPGVTVVNAPQVEISSTFIREALAAGADVNFFLPAGVYRYISEHALYAPRKN
jgi:nicotinate-nucleotide adenylyltransferase